MYGQLNNYYYYKKQTKKTKHCNIYKLQSTVKKKKNKNIMTL